MPLRENHQNASHRRITSYPFIIHKSKENELQEIYLKSHRDKFYLLYVKLKEADIECSKRQDIVPTQ